jgi:hypothetical protein
VVSRWHCGGILMISPAFIGAISVTTASVVDPTVKSLLHFDGSSGSTTFTDVTGKAWSPTGSAQISTAQSMFGGSSGLFNGSTDFIATPPHADWDWGAEDFTVEAWVYLLAAPATIFGAVVFDCESVGGSNGWLLRVQPGANGLSFVIPGTIGFDHNVPLSLNAWHHVMACRSAGSDIWVGVDGSASHPGGYSSTSWPTTNPLQMGGANATSGRAYLNGYIDESRISKGIARYAGATYTVPTAPFT